MRHTLKSPRLLRIEVLGALVVARALIPEAIAFSIIAGVDPRLGLFASFTMAVSIAFLGGRPAMISAATAATALVIATLVTSHGVDYLIATVIPDVPWTLETLQVIARYALAMALVGLIESLMTAKLVDDITDTLSNKVRESWGQGCANIITGFRGGIVALIPMAGLVAVMIFVSIAIFDWHSIRISTLRMMPKSETTVMLVTVERSIVEIVGLNAASSRMHERMGGKLGGGH
ncbi:MAG: SulP family inorganic anion transporter [Aeromicrobium sp.]|nr:MAG: SulP family inorganic anion transporter [Aeromicrobium sp.]